MKKTMLTSLMAALLCTSCSMNKRVADIGEEDQANVDLSAQSFKLSETDEDTIEFFDGSEEVLLDQSEVVADSIYNDESILENGKDQAMQTILTETDSLGNKLDEYDQYVVKDYDSLMVISYKLYGTYSRWKEIARKNGDVVGEDLTIRPGQTLLVKKSDYIPVKKIGNEYLIRKEDSLGLISQKVYNGQMRYWKSIWHNNLDLIEDPNRIFAGFTLYYLDLQDAKRNLASDKVVNIEFRREKKERRKKLQALKSTSKNSKTL